MSQSPRARQAGSSVASSAAARSPLMFFAMRRSTWKKNSMSSLESSTSRSHSSLTLLNWRLLTKRWMARL